MLTSGEILKNKRVEIGLSLSDVEKITKIRQKFLLALEEGRLDSLPGKTYVSGFVRNYSEFLSLPVESVLAVMRREYDDQKKKVLIPSGLTKPLLAQSIFTKKLAIPLTFFLALLLLGIYLYTQYRSFGSAPNLTVVSPPDKIEIKKEILDIKGRTDKEARVFVNGQEITVEENGQFLQKINLTPGENTIAIISVNKQGKETKIERVVNRR